MIGIKFNNPQTFNFDQMTNGKGLHHFTLRNTGNTNIIVDDHTQEVIEPTEVWIIESDIPVVNDNIRFAFGAFTGVGNALNEGIVRYIIEKEKTL